MNDIQVNGVSMGIRMVSWEPFTRAVSDAAVAVTGFADAVIHAQWQWKVSEDMQWAIDMYRRICLANAKNGVIFTNKIIQKQILRQRRLDRRYKFPSFFRLI